MRRWFSLLVIVLFASSCMIECTADTQQNSFSYRIKGNGNAEITGYDWNNGNSDIFVPQFIDGYTVTAIADEAFSKGFDGVEYKRKAGEYTVHLPDSITTIGEKAFFGTPIVLINIPEKVEFIGAGALCGCPYLKSISVDRNNSRYVVKDGILYDKKEKAVAAFMQGYSEKTSEKEPIVIPDGIQKINDYAFYWMDYYQRKHSETIYVTIPQSVTSIGSYAFAYRALNAKNESDDGNFFDSKGKGIVKMDLKLDSIGEYAFYNAAASMNLVVSKMGEHAFEGFYALGFFTCKCENIPDYAFYSAEFHGHNPDVQGDYRSCIFRGVKSIGDYAFYEAEWLLGIDFSTCTYIGNSAFEHCNCALESNLPELQIHAEHIGDRAFYACAWFLEGYYELSDGVVEIGKEAFCGSRNTSSGVEYVKKMYIPKTVTAIDELAFERLKTTVVVEPGSYAEYWAKENGFDYEVNGMVDDWSWLE